MTEKKGSTNYAGLTWITKKHIKEAKDSPRGKRYGLIYVGLRSSSFGLTTTDVVPPRLICDSESEQKLKTIQQTLCDKKTGAGHLQKNYIVVYLGEPGDKQYVLMFVGLNSSFTTRSPPDVSIPQVICGSSSKESLQMILQLLCAAGNHDEKHYLITEL